MDTGKLDLLLVGEEDYMLPPPEDRSTVGLLTRLLLRLGNSSESVTPPRMGKVLLATYAERAGFSTAVADDVLGSPLGRLRFLRLLSRAPLAVGVSTVAIRHRATLQRIAEIIRKRSPGSKIILGGQGAAAYPEMRGLGDITVTGYGENALLKALRTLKAGEELSAIPGARREGGALLLPGDDYYESGAMLTPDWRHYARRSARLTIEASRGCRFNCSFCTLPGHRRQVFRAPDEVLAELERDVREFGASRISFVDSTFTGDAAFISAFLDRLEASGLRTEWDCYSRVDDFARLPWLPARMAGAGCVNCCIGLESIHDDILRRMRKGYTRKIIEDGLSRLEGLNVQVNLIVGFPGDTREKVEELADFVRRFPIKAAVVTPLFVPPALFEEARANPELFCHLRGESADSWTHDTMSSAEAVRLAAWSSAEIKKVLAGR